MNNKIIIETSARHIHLSQTDANILFKEDYQFKKRNDLWEFGEICLYLSNIKRSFNDSSTKEYLTPVLILKLYF